MSIEGIVIQLWEPSSSSISRVGLIEDESGKTKFTNWMASDQPWIEEGERVRIHGQRTGTTGVSRWPSTHPIRRDNHDSTPRHNSIQGRKVRRQQVGKPTWPLPRDPRSCGWHCNRPHRFAARFPRTAAPSSMTAVLYGLSERFYRRDTASGPPWYLLLYRGKSPSLSPASVGG